VFWLDAVGKAGSLRHVYGSRQTPWRRVPTERQSLGAQRRTQAKPQAERKKYGQQVQTMSDVLAANYSQVRSCTFTAGSL